MAKKPCNGCSYYEQICLNIFPFEYCYKHNKMNKKPNDFIRCDLYTNSKLIKFKVLIESIKKMFKMVIQ